MFLLGSTVAETFLGTLRLGMCQIPDRYPVYGAFCGIRLDSASLSGRIPDIFKVQGNCVE